MTFDAALHATTDAATEPADQAVSLGLGGLSAGIASMGSVTVTVDGVPDAARLSAGQFLGDGTWTVRVADLDGLALYPSPGHNRNCRIAIRLRKIDKDLDESFSIGAVYVDVDADAGRSAIADTEGAISLRRKGTDSESAPPETLAPKPVQRDTAPPEKAASKPVQRIVRVTEANPVQSTVSPEADVSPPRAPSDRVPKDQGIFARTPVPAPVELPFQDIATPNSSELGIAPPEVLDENARSPYMSAPAFAPAPVPASATTFAPEPALAPARTSPILADQTGIVPVHVTPGLRISKFGKTGRPEDVVSVRGRDVSAMREHPDRSRSVVTIRSRLEDSRSA